MNEPASTSMAGCRICRKADDMEILYSFGEMPVAGYLETSLALAKTTPRLNNSIAICKACGLVQQAFNEAHELLVERVYSNYQPTYSMSDKVRQYMAFFLDLAFQNARVLENDYVMEVGSNDSAVLALVKDRGFKPVGFDPSANIASPLTSGALVIKDFFGFGTAQEFVDAYGKVKLIFSRHTLEHIFDPLDFFQGIESALAPEGIAVIEVPYLRLQIMNNQFQSMTFQHICFFTVTSLLTMLGKVDLELFGVEFSTMDAGSMIALIRKSNRKSNTPTTTERILDFERALELDQAAGYDAFFSYVDRQRAYIRDYFESQCRKSVSVVAYGAGSKGQAMLNMLKIDADTISYVIDDTPGYSGRFVPGVGTEVINSKDARAQAASIVFVTAPTHIQEIVSKREAWIARGVTFVGTAPGFHFLMSQDLSPTAQLGFHV